jgi:hypothetical protein
MGHEVIVEAVLPGEGGLADGAFKRAQSRMAPTGAKKWTMTSAAKTMEDDEKQKFLGTLSI